MARETTGYELSREKQYKFVRDLPKCTDALDEKRRNPEKRVLHDAEIIPLDKRQDFLRAIFEANHKPLGELEHIDVYNPAIIALPNGEIEFLGRAEARKTPFSTLVVHFRLVDGVWTPQDNIALQLQDPAVAYIGNQIVVAGVESKMFAPPFADYKTVFYKGTSLDNLKRLKEESPLCTKGVRLEELKVLIKGVAVYTRPIGLREGLGQIGFTTIDSLDDLNEEVIRNAPLINARFPEGEWGGVNQAQELPDGRIFGLGHRAYKDNVPSRAREDKKKARHYYPWAFIHDPVTGEIQDLGILAESSNFPKTDAKAWDLRDVLYSAGFILDQKNNRLTLFVGTRDTGVGKVVIENFKIPPAPKVLA